MSHPNYNKWVNDYSLTQHSCDGVVLDSGDGEYIVKGTIQTTSSNATILFWAANPPTYTTSFTGSGMPFPNAEIAYDNSPNRGAVKIKGSQFQFRIRYPNAYYTALGTVYVPPCVHVKVCENGSNNDIHTIKLGSGIPFRMQTYPVGRTSPLFYDGMDKLPIRTQEQILRDSGYPEKNIMPVNFWGLKPPM